MPAKKREPLTVKIEGDWEDAVGKALVKEKPPEGWPKPEAMPQRAPKPSKKS